LIDKFVGGFERMFLFSIRSRVNPKSAYAKANPDVGGAYANCYVSFKDYDGAEKLAKLLIREQGFIPENDIEAWKLKKQKLKTKKDKQYYAEALKFGYCLVFHTWPNDAEDTDVG
jgi:hypothetical protein